MLQWEFFDNQYDQGQLELANEPVQGVWQLTINIVVQSWNSCMKWQSSGCMAYLEAGII